MKNRINLLLAGIAILAVIAATITTTIVYYNIFQKQVINDLKISAKLLQDTHFFENVDINSSEIDLSANINELRVTWIDKDGTVLYDNDANAQVLANHSDRPEVQEAFLSGVGESVRRSDTLNRDTFYYARLLDNGTVLRISKDAVNIWSVYVAAGPVIVVIIGLIIIVCIIFSRMLTAQILKPIEVMAENIQDTSVRPPYKELIPFANMIRKQHSDILSAARVKQDFTANVSHELKTPLTAISGYAELIDSGMVDAEKGKHFLGEIRKNADRLLSLINDIIRLSELDRNNEDDGFEALDLYDVVSECMEALKVNAGRRQVTLHFKGEHCIIRGNYEMIRELTDNLVQNAIRYNNEGGNVWVEVNPGEEICLVVRDDGIGIPAEDRERVFERFYRVDKSRSRETGGTGLGLAIVKNIVELHGAGITLESTKGEGTCITVKF